MKARTKILLILLALCLCNCEDILEEDISDKTVSINFPGDGQEIISNVVNFQWNEIDGADDYRIQVYENSQNIVLDSLVGSNTFSYPLAAGSYQWRVRGENFAYKTAYSFPVSFTLVETDDLTNQQVQLTSPSSSFYTNNAATTFLWSAINVAQYYNFQLVNVTNGNSIVYQQEQITGTSLSLTASTINQDAQYQWKVLAVNTDNDTQTQYSTRTFYIDTTAPATPQNSAPVNNAQINLSQSVNFQWNISSDIGAVTSPISYVLEIATDQGFSSIIETATVSISSYQYTFSTSGTYYWRIRAFDTAGNVGAYSTASKIILQ